MILITGDIHLNDLARDQYRHDWMRKILPELLRKHKAKLLIILGDLTDSKDEHNAWLTNSIVDHLTTLVQICPIIINKGNHDYVEADNPFFEFLGKIPGITWISVPTSASLIPAAEILGDALFLPHTNFYKKEWDFHTGWEHDIYLTHQTYAGAAVGPRKMEGIPTSIFPKDSLIISGDVHYPQQFDQIVYCGSPYTCNFGDSFEPRVLLLDPVKLTYKSIPSPGPQKRLIEIRSLTELHKPNIHTHLSKGDILKIRFVLQPSQTPRWATIKDDIKQWGLECGYNIYLIQPLIDKTESGSMAKRKTVTRTDEELLELHVKSKSASEATLITGQKLAGKV